MEYKDILAPTDQMISDTTFISRLTSSLPDSYDTTIQLLHQCGNLTVSEYLTAIRQHEATLRIKNSANTNINTTGTSGSALFSNSNNQRRGNFNGHDRTNFRGFNPGNYRGYNNRNLQNNPNYQ
jgi:hypothetical protein